MQAWAPCGRGCSQHGIRPCDGEMTHWREDENTSPLGARLTIVLLQATAEALERRGRKERECRAPKSCAATLIEPHRGMTDLYAAP